MSEVAIRPEVLRRLLNPVPSVLAIVPPLNPGINVEFHVPFSRRVHARHHHQRQQEQGPSSKSQFRLHADDSTADFSALRRSLMAIRFCIVVSLSSASSFRAARKRRGEGTLAAAACRQ